MTKTFEHRIRKALLEMGQVVAPLPQGPHRDELVVELKRVHATLRRVVADLGGAIRALESAAPGRKWRGAPPARLTRHHHARS